MKFRVLCDNDILFFLGAGILLSSIIIPLPAASSTIAPVIDQGATIYIGEEGLNLTHALNRAGGLDGTALDSTEPTNWTIGWWISDVAHSTSSSSRNIGTTYRSFTVTPDSFVGYTGSWYLEDPAHPRQALLDAGGHPYLVFKVNDPRLDIRIRDMDLDMDVTGKSTPQGDALGFRIDTNMYGALNEQFRSPIINSAEDGYIDIKVKNEAAYTYTELLDNLGTPHSLLRQNVSYTPWIWGDPENPAASSSWATGAENPGGGSAYPVGTYTVVAESRLNNMKANYRQGGADYTGKTVSQAYTITLVSDLFQIQLNKKTVARGDRIPMVITGRPKGIYYVWVNDTGAMTGGPGDQPPTILPASMVFQDPDAGPYDAIGGHEILGEGRKINEDVPPSTEKIPRNAYYAKVIPSSFAVFLEFRTSADTKPGTYVIRAENGVASDEVTVTVLPEVLPAATESADASRIITHPLVNPDVPAPVNADLKRISRGGTVFIGEDGLDISGAVGEARALAVPALPPRTVIGWGMPFYDITTCPALGTVDMAGRETAFFVSPAAFVGYTGTWYLIDPHTGMAAVDNTGSPIPVLTVADPSLGIRVWDTTTNTDVTGKTVPQGERLTFRIDTDMYPVFDSRYRPDITGTTPGSINVILRNKNGARYSYLYRNNEMPDPLSDLLVDNQPWFWGSQHATPSAGGSWDTGLLDRDRYYYYPAGTYTVCAESTLNRMKENYLQGGAFYTGKTISQCDTITVVAVLNAKIGVFRNGHGWFLDSSGNGAWSAADDTAYGFGMTGDIPVTGDWNHDGITEIGVFRNGHGWFLDSSGNGVWNAAEDTAYGFGMAGDVPVTGDWNHDGTTEIGVFRNGHGWFLDSSGNGVWNAAEDTAYGFGMAGDVPVTGDWNHDGTTEIGVFRNGHGWFLDSSGNGVWNAAEDTAYGFGMAGDVPVTGDWNHDGTTEIGVFRNGHGWFLDSSGNGAWGAGDTTYGFGTTGDVPVIGKWEVKER